MTSNTEDEYTNILQEMESSEPSNPLAPTSDWLDGLDLDREGTAEPPRHEKSSRPRSSDTSDEENQLEGSSPLSHTKRARLENHTALSANNCDLAQFIPQLIPGRRFTQRSLAELKAFAKATPAQREIMQFAVSLEIRDLQKSESKTLDESWVVPPKLRKNAQRYCAVFTFAPSAIAYKTGVHKAVLLALRANKIEGMPPESDRSKNETLGGQCRKYLSDNRADLKKPIKKSFEQYEEMVRNGTFVVGDSELNIGHVAVEVFKGYRDVHPTPAHLARLAWLRHLIANKKVSAGESFWDDVDKKLAELREAARKQNPSNPKAYTDRVFKAILDKDQQTYGTAKLDCLTALTELPEWQRNVEEIAGKL